MSFRNPRRVGFAPDLSMFLILSMVLTPLWSMMPASRAESQGNYASESRSVLVLNFKDGTGSAPAGLGERVASAVMSELIARGFGASNIELTGLDGSLGQEQVIESDLPATLRDAIRSNVVEFSEIQSIIQNPTTESAARLGRAMGTDYVLLGVVDDYETKQTRRGRTSQIRVTATGRFYNSSNGQAAEGGIHGKSVVGPVRGISRQKFGLRSDDPLLGEALVNIAQGLVGGWIGLDYIEIEEREAKKLPVLAILGGLAVVGLVVALAGGGGSSDDAAAGSGGNQSARDVHSIPVPTGVQIVWEHPVSGAPDQYHIIRGLGGAASSRESLVEYGISGQIIYTTAGTQKQYLDTTVSAFAGQMFSYSVAAVVNDQAAVATPATPDGSGNSPLVGYNIPTAPNNMTAQAGDQFVNLSWQASSESFVVGYNLYSLGAARAILPSDSPIVFLNGRYNSSYIDSPVTNQVTRYYRLTAKSYAGYESAGTALAYGTPGDLPPQAPSNLIASAGDNKVTLQWTSSIDPDVAQGGSYRIYRINRGRGPRSHSARSRALQNGLRPLNLKYRERLRMGTAVRGGKDSGTQIGDVSGSVNVYVDDTATNGNSFEYYVTAVDPGGQESGSSNHVIITPFTELEKPILAQNTDVITGDKKIQLDLSRVKQQADSFSGDTITGILIYRATVRNGTKVPYLQSLNVLQGLSNPLPFDQLEEVGSTLLFTDSGKDFVGEELPNNTNFYYNVAFVGQNAGPGDKSNTELSGIAHGSVNGLVVSASPSAVSGNGSMTSSIQAKATDFMGQAVGGVKVAFNIISPDGGSVPERGTLKEQSTGFGSWGSSTPGTLETFPAFTGLDGWAYVVYTANKSGTSDGILQPTDPDLSLVIEASTAGTWGQSGPSDTVNLVVQAPKPAGINLTPELASLEANGFQSTKINANVTDVSGQRVADGTVVVFDITGGPVSPNPTGVINLDQPHNGALQLPEAGASYVQQTSISGTGAITTADGLATVNYRAGTKIGDVVISARVLKTESPVTFYPALGSTSLSLSAGAPFQVTLSTQPTESVADGASTISVAANLADEYGNPVSNSSVSFTSNTGNISQSSVDTDSYGNAITSLIAPTIPGIGIVTASAGQANGQTSIVFTSGGPATIDIAGFTDSETVSPLPLSGIFVTHPSNQPVDKINEATIKALVSDSFGNAIPGASIQWTAPSGIVETSSDVVKSAYFNITDATGHAYASYTSSRYSGNTTITVITDSVTANYQISLRPLDPANIHLQPTPFELPVDGNSSASLVATVRDINGNLVDENTLIDFTITAPTANTGQFVGAGPTAKVLTTNGIATASYQAPTNMPSPARATIQAAYGAISETANVAFTTVSVGQITLTVDRPDIYVTDSNGDPVDGDLPNSAVITVEIYDTGGNPIRNLPNGTTITLTAGDTSAKFIDKTDNDGTINLSPNSQVNLVLGRANGGSSPETGQVTLRSGETARTIQVAALSTASATTSLNFLAGPPAAITLTAEPREILNNTESSSTITGALVDRLGNPVEDGTAVVFTTTEGIVIPGSTTTSGGLAITSLVATEDIIEARQAIVTLATGTISATAPPVQFNPVLATTMDLVAFPISVLGNGTSTLEITATIRNLSGNAVGDGGVVAFGTTQGQIIAQTTTAGGVATATLQSALVTANTEAIVTATYTNPPNSDPTQIQREVDITFVGSEKQMTLVVTPPSIIADGLTTATILATITDSSGQAVPGEGVIFTATKGTMTVLNNTTDVNGIATAVLISSTEAGTTTIEALSGSLAKGTTVTLLPGPAELVEISASPNQVQPTANGTDSFTINASIYDIRRNVVVDGTAVQFSTTDAGGLTTTTSSLTVNGLAQSSLSTRNAGPASIAVTSGTSTTQTAVVFADVTFTGDFTITTSQQTRPADGASTATITGTLVDFEGRAISGRLVSFTASEGVITATGLTGANGSTTGVIYTAPFIVPAPGGGDITITAKYGAQSNQEDSLTIRIVPGTPASITLTATPTQILASGNDRTEIIANVLSATGDGVPNATINFTATDGTLNTANSPTDINGNARVVLTSSTLGNVISTVNATVVGAAIVGTVLIPFEAGTPTIVDLQLADATLFAGTLNGFRQETQVIANVIDEFGNAVANGTSVEFKLFNTMGQPATGGSEAGLAVDGNDPLPSVITQTTGGSATVNIVGTNKDGDTSGNGLNAIVATDLGAYRIEAAAQDTNGIARAAALTQLVFIGPPVSLDARVTLQSIEANGIDETTIAVTARDLFGNLVPDSTSITFNHTFAAVGGGETGGGTLSSGSATTLNGTGTVQYQAGTKPGTATITAIASLGNALATSPSSVTLALNSANLGSITLIAGATTLTVSTPTNPDQTTLNATVRDINSIPVSEGTLISFRVTTGTITPSSPTDSTGVATATLISGSVSGTAIVSASVDRGNPFNDTLSATQDLIYEAAEPNRISIAFDKPNLLANGLSTNQVTATVVDENGNLVSDNTDVAFSVTAFTGGSIEDGPVFVGGQSTTTIGGDAIATLRSQTTSGKATISAQANPDSIPAGPSSSAQLVLVEQQITQIDLSAGVQQLYVGGIGAGTQPSPVNTKITATARDAGGKVVEGSTITFETSAGGFEEQDPGDLGGVYEVNTNALGIAEVTYNTNRLNNEVQRVQDITITATAADGPAITGLMLALLPGPIDHFTIQALPSVIAANGTSEAIINAIALDQNENPVPSQTITFVTDNGTVLTPTLVTDANGFGTTKLLSESSSTEITATVQARRGDSTPGTATVIFRPVVPAQITVVPSVNNLIASDPSASSENWEKTTITAQIIDVNGDPVPDGTEVSLQTSLGDLYADFPTTRHLTVPERSASLTSIAGQATATLFTRETAGTATIFASAGSITSTVIVNFNPAPADGTNSSLTPSPATIVADATTTSTITAVILDQFKNPRAGDLVVFTASDGTLTNPATGQTGSQIDGTTDIQGQAPVTFSSPRADAAGIAISAFFGDSNKQTSVIVTSLGAAVISITGPGRLTANGTDNGEVVATVLDANDRPVPDGSVVGFTTSLGTITNAATTVGGNATAIITSSKTSGIAVISANISGLAPAQVNVMFEPDVTAIVTVNVDPDQILADGKSMSNVTATLRDQNNNLVKDGTLAGFALTKAVDQDNVVHQNNAPYSGIDPRNEAFIVGTGTTTNGSVTATLVSSIYPTGDTGSDRGITVSVNAEGISGTAIVEFKAVTASAITLVATAATITVSDQGDLSGDGAVGPEDLNTSTTITATILGPDLDPLNPVKGETVEFRIDRGSFTERPSAAVKAVTVVDGGLSDADGQLDGIVSVDLYSTQVAGSATVEAVVRDLVTGGSKARQTFPVSYRPDEPDIQNSSLLVNPASLPANGINTSVVTTTWRDKYDNLVADGTQVTFGTANGTIASTGTTGNGVATAILTSGILPVPSVPGGSELVEITATAPAGGGLSRTLRTKNDVRETTPGAGPERILDIDVTFVPAIPATVLVDRQPAWVIADGVTTSNITATVLDNEGNAVKNGTVVLFDATQGAITSSGTTVNGIAFATFQAGIVAGPVSIAAGIDLNDNGILDLPPAEGDLVESTTITLVAGAIANIDLNNDPAANYIFTLPADGLSTANFVVSATDGFGNPAQGIAVTWGARRLGGNPALNPGTVIPQNNPSDTDALGQSRVTYRSSGDAGMIEVVAIVTDSRGQDIEASKQIGLFGNSDSIVLEYWIHDGEVSQSGGPLERLHFWNAIVEPGDSPIMAGPPNSPNGHGPFWTRSGEYVSRVSSIVTGSSFNPLPGPLGEVTIPSDSSYTLTYDPRGGEDAMPDRIFVRTTVFDTAGVRAPDGTIVSFSWSGSGTTAPTLSNETQQTRNGTTQPYTYDSGTQPFLGPLLRGLWGQSTTITGGSDDWSGRLSLVVTDPQNRFPRSPSSGSHTDWATPIDPDDPTEPQPVAEVGG